MIEQRFVGAQQGEATAAAAPIEVRADDDGISISGYAAVFHRSSDPGTEFKIGRNIVERIHRDAFRDALQDDDVVALFNHQPDNILGSIRGDSLTLSVDRKGLRYQIKADPENVTAQQVAMHVRNRDVFGSSFAFDVLSEEWIEEESRTIRVIRSVKLHDVGPVTYPAYKSTKVDTRAVEARAAELADAARVARMAKLAEVRDATTSDG